MQKKKKMKTITLFFTINKREKGLIVFKKEFAEKYKNKIKIIYDNKIFDLKSVLPCGSDKYSIKVKLLLLSDILYFSKIIDNLEYLPEHLYNDNIFPESILYKFPKLVYDTLGEDDYISLFNKGFAFMNFNKIMLLYQNIIFPIRAYLPKYNMDEDDEKLEIFLIALKKPDNLMGMFEECSDLEEISINVKDKEIIPENNQNDLTNTISKFTIYNTEDNEKNSNAYKLAREMERNEDNENLTSSIPIQPEPTKYYTVKYLLTNYFKELNTNTLDTETSYFKDIPSLIEISDITKWKPSCADSMFQDCSSLKSIPDISNWNTENLVTIHSMFYNCKNLISIPDISK
jgi:surface protein